MSFSSSQERFPLIPSDIKPLPSAGQTYLGCLDGLRVVLALGIVMAHLEFYFDPVHHFRTRMATYRIVGGTPLVFLTSGRYCVFCFCLIAGYVNSLKALRARNYRFLIHGSHKRFLRLWPLMLFVQVAGSSLVYFFQIAAPRGTPFTDCSNNFTLECLQSPSALGIIPAILRVGAWGATGTNGLYFTAQMWVFFWLALCPPFCLVLYSMCVNKGAGQQFCGMFLCFTFSLSPYTMPLVCFTAGFFVAMAQTGHLDDLRDHLSYYFPVSHVQHFSTYFWLAACCASHTFMFTHGYQTCTAINQGGPAWCNVPVFVSAFTSITLLLVTPILQFAYMATRIGFLGKYTYACYVMHLMVFHVFYVLGGWTFFGSADYEPDIADGVELTGKRTIVGAPNLTVTTYCMLTAVVTVCCIVAAHHLIEMPFVQYSERFADWMVPLDEDKNRADVRDAIPATIEKEKTGVNNAV